MLIDSTIVRVIISLSYLSFLRFLLNLEFLASAEFSSIGKDWVHPKWFGPIAQMNCWIFVAFSVEISAHVLSLCSLALDFALTSCLFL